MDIDLPFRMDEPTPITDDTDSHVKRIYEKWDRSNRLSLMIIKAWYTWGFKDAISDEITNAKDFLAQIEKYFEKSDKTETNTLLKRLISMKFKCKENIREYIIEMSHVASKLKALKLEMSEDLLVHLVLISLHVQFSQFQVSYNCQKEKWSLNELISYCDQEKERLKQDRIDNANLEITPKRKNKGQKIKNDEIVDYGPLQNK